MPICPEMPETPSSNPLALVFPATDRLLTWLLQEDLMRGHGEDEVTQHNMEFCMVVQLLCI